MIKVVNMIPQSLSGETNQDSEPNIAVNPANPSQIAGSAFTPSPMGGANAPIYVSTDGGDTWSLNNIVPSAGSSGTGDITLKFAGTSSRLFTSILDGATGDFEVHRSTDFTSPTVMSQLEGRSDEDQPYVQATTVMGGGDVGKDRVYIGVNDFNAPGGKTATVEQTLDGGVAAPSFSSIRLETRTTLGQDGPQVRPAVHGDGTIYAAFYRWISSSGSFGANTLVITNAEVIVVRDDQWGTGASPFTALTDSSDSLSGRRVATGLSFPFNKTGVAANGQERWGGDISIAVDPRNSSTVYLVYSTLVSGVYTLSVTRSIDRGVNWSATLLSIANAKNPAIAVNSLGKIGLVCQQLSGTGSTQRWETHFRDSIDGTTWNDSVLCTALSQSPTRTFSPYVGDYLHMMAVGKDFYGVFSANNTPDPANFPQGVTYQRNHDFAAKKLFALDGVTVVPPSIDPFFFKVTEIDPTSGSDFYVRDWTDSAVVHDTGLEPSTHPVFYAFSDVWNQRTNVAPTFVSDQPQNQDPQNDATNFAFARISRNTSDMAETVNAEFLVAEFGTGSPYQSVATTTVNFATGDTSKIATASWTLNPTSSTHLCLAVQVSTPTDPFVSPGLNGNTPGWPTTDLLVINDNNKAQRNMSVHYGLSGFGSKHYAIIRNASKKSRDFILKLDASPEALKGFSKPTVQGQGGGDPIPFKPGAILTVPGMKSGEYRWVSFDMASFNAKTRSSLPIDFFEMVDNRVVNGFRMNIVSSTAAQALTELLLFNMAVFQRLQLQFKIHEAADVVKASKSLLKTKTISLDTYRKFISTLRDAIGKCVKRFLDAGDNDSSLDIASSLALFLKSLDAKDARNAFASYVTLLNKLDVAVTLLQKRKT
jgi:hypothetical protein